MNKTTFRDYVDYEKKIMKGIGDFFRFFPVLKILLF